MTNRIKKLAGILSVAALLLLLVYYNNRRTFGVYQIGFNKEISINAIPFKDFIKTIVYFETNILLKMLYFFIVGMVLRTLLAALSKDEPRFYIAACGITVLCFEVTNFITSSLTVIIDINNLIFYSIGFFAAYIAFGV